MKKKVLVIVGPTAIGKSGLAVELAKKLNGEIVSADSRQVYKGLDIGTGKVTEVEMQGVPHHMLDVADPKKVYSASEFKTQGEVVLKDIAERNRLPIIVGGTGFYIDALTGSASLPQVPPNPKLRTMLEKLPTEKLFALLKKKDPVRAKTIDTKNKVRLVRALEIIEAMGTVPTLKKQRSPYEFVFVGLATPQEDLDKKIRARLIQRMPGMIREAKKLKADGLSYKRMDELGLEYRHLALYLQKKVSKKEMLEDLFIAIRQYSRRQMTWFKKNKNIRWFTAPLSPYGLSTIRTLLAGEK
ncbi:MAG: tRNA (adenosine(37)-N6)-dimethylallyltransferase MiaA [Patescibacteria group bacterium]